MTDGPELGRPYRFEMSVWWFGYRHARDIPDHLFLNAIRIASKERAELQGWAKPLPAHLWDVISVLGIGYVTEDLDAEIKGVPHKVVLAKAKKLIKRGVIRGCACGCRGDFEMVR